MAHDFKRLCNELLSYLYQCNWPDGKRFYALVERTRAALAEPEPEKQMTEKLTPEHIKNFLAKYENPADARKFLLEAGLIDESGNLTVSSQRLTSCNSDLHPMMNRPIPSDSELELLVIAIQALRDPDTDGHQLNTVDRGRELLREALARWGK